MFKPVPLTYVILISSPSKLQGEEWKQLLSQDSLWQYDFLLATLWLTHIKELGRNSHKKKRRVIKLEYEWVFQPVLFLTVILVALLSALTQSTRSCWSLACRKNFLIPALMTNRWNQQENCITTTWIYGYSQVIFYQKTIFHKKWQRYDVTYFSRS